MSAGGVGRYRPAMSLDEAMFRADSSLQDSFQRAKTLAQVANVPEVVNALAPHSGGNVGSSPHPRTMSLDEAMFRADSSLRDLFQRAQTLAGAANIPAVVNAFATHSGVAGPPTPPSAPTAYTNASEARYSTQSPASPTGAGGTYAAGPAPMYTVNPPPVKEQETTRNSVNANSPASPTPTSPSPQSPVDRPSVGPPGTSASPQSPDVRPSVGPTATSPSPQLPVDRPSIGSSSSNPPHTTCDLGFPEYVKGTANSSLQGSFQRAESLAQAANAPPVVNALATQPGVSAPLTPPPAPAAYANPSEKRPSNPPPAPTTGAGGTVNPPPTGVQENRNSVNANPPRSSTPSASPQLPVDRPSLGPPATSAPQQSPVVRQTVGSSSSNPSHTPCDLGLAEYIKGTANSSLQGSVQRAGGSNASPVVNALATQSGVAGPSTPPPDPAAYANPSEKRPSNPPPASPTGVGGTVNPPPTGEQETRNSVNANPPRSSTPTSPSPQSPVDRPTLGPPATSASPQTPVDRPSVSVGSSSSNPSHTPCDLGFPEYIKGTVSGPGGQLSMAPPGGAPRQLPAGQGQGSPGGNQNLSHGSISSPGSSQSPGGIPEIRGAGAEAVNLPNNPAQFPANNKTDAVQQQELDQHINQIIQEYSHLDPCIPCAPCPPSLNPPPNPPPQH